MPLTHERKHTLGLAIAYLVVSAYCGLFTIVYYQFSHSMTTPYLTYLFVYPLVLDLYYWILVIAKKGTIDWADLFLGGGLASLVIWAQLEGIYYIAEASNSWTVLFLILAILLVFAGFVVGVALRVARNEKAQAS
jgi:hypothetical protein